MSPAPAGEHHRSAGAVPAGDALQLGHPAAWSFQLTLRGRGLGSCWTTLHLPHEKEVADILGTPYGQVQQVGLICVANVNETRFRPAPREPLEAKVHGEGW